MQSSAVPRFGSFKPKSTSAPASATTSEDKHNSANATRGTHSRRSRSRSPRRRRDGHHNHRNGRNTLDVRDIRRESNPSTHSGAVAEDLATRHTDHNTDHDLFRVDRRGDPDILKYGAGSSLPLYRLPNQRKTLGIPRGLAVQSSSSKSLLSALRKDERLSLRKEPLNILTSTNKEHEDEPEHEPEYVALDSRRKRRRLSRFEGRELGHLDSSDDTLDDASDSQIHETATRSYPAIRAENARLSQCVKAEPHNAQGWTDFIAYQHNMQSLLEADPTSPQAQSLSALKLSLYQEALSKLGKDHKDRDAFQLRMLHEASRVWAASKLAKKWKDAALESPNSLLIQRGYLDFCQTESSFSFEDCRELYCRHMDLLQTHSFESGSERLSHQLYIILRFTSMARDAGFQELARGVWQGLLHLYAFSNSADNSDQHLVILEEFWDSEETRIGEANDQIFSAEVEGRLPSALPSTNAQGARAWASNEFVLATHANDSKGTEDKSDDPYHTVLFADIRPFLVTVPSGNAELLLDSLLCFDGLRGSFPSSSNTNRSYSADPFLHQMNTPGQLSNVVGEPRVLFDKSYPTARASDANLLRAALELLVETARTTDTTAEYYISFMLQHYTSKSRKAAKTLLKTRPLSLRLYNSLSFVEKATGDTQALERVLVSALKMSVSLLPEQRADNAFLLQTLIWHAIAEQDASRALEHLRTFVDSTPAYESLIRSRDASIKSQSISHAVIYSELLAIESYLVNDFDIVSALDTFCDETSVFSSIGSNAAFAMELLYQAQAHLIDFHTSRFKSYSPAAIRPALRACVLAYPSNSLFLQHFAANESRFLIDGRVRTIVADTILSEENPSVVSWLAYLDTEISNGDGHGATQHSIRAAFERSINSRNGAHCEAIWAKYLEYEATAIQNLRKAKDVYYRGLGNVPWSKRFMMLAFECDMIDAFTEKELRAVYELMLDRGMRIYVEWDT